MLNKESMLIAPPPSIDNTTKTIKITGILSAGSGDYLVRLIDESGALNTSIHKSINIDDVTVSFEVPEYVIGEFTDTFDPTGYLNIWQTDSDRIIEIDSVGLNVLQLNDSSVALKIKPGATEAYYMFETKAL